MTMAGQYGMGIWVSMDRPMLRQAVQTVSYKAGWAFSLGAYGGFGAAMFLKIDIHTPDSDNPGREVLVCHNLPVPPWDDYQANWPRWLFEQIMLVEQHEAREFFRLAGDRIFYPPHGPTENPYSMPS